uniref:Uncharacterized protein n=1 Tax=Meloidogyne enterolobii TaxID=390850 RepID=A0A6V7VHT2_MELEN|nr:unnamed protein product [Meloidogyne enterolobii]
MLKLFEWLRNLTPLQREKVLCFLAIGFKRYAAQFINGLEERHTNRKNHRNISTKHNNLSIYLALQLKKNAFLFSSQQKILPRSPPFNCPKCGFSSRRLRPVMRHLCTRRAHEYKNVIHTATLGFRSRCRDALAIMERIPYPQRIKYLENDEKEKELFLLVSNKLKQPKTLREIAGNFVHNLFGLDNTNCIFVETNSFWCQRKESSLTASMSEEDVEEEGNEKEEEKDEENEEEHIGVEGGKEMEEERREEEKEDINEAKEEERIKEGMEVVVNEEEDKNEERKEGEEGEEEAKLEDENNEKEKQQNSQTFTYSDGNAYFCRMCAHLFGQKSDWTSHLCDNKYLQNDKEKEPLEIQVDLEEQFPTSGSFIPSYSKLDFLNKTNCESTTMFASVCTKCFETNFASRSEFHEHLFKCALSDR